MNEIRTDVQIFEAEEGWYVCPLCRHFRFSRKFLAGRKAVDALYVHLSLQHDVFLAQLPVPKTVEEWDAAICLAATKKAFSK